MHYLECITMLMYLLRKLNAGQRTQVSVNVLNELKTVLSDVNKRLENVPSTEIIVLLRDLNQALFLVDMAPGTMFITETMKDSLVQGITELKEAVSLEAFNYYKTNNFEPTPRIIPIMRDVVQVAAQKGLV